MYGKVDELFECPVCLAPFEETDEVISLTCSNKHILHLHCLEDAFKKGMKECPLCRAKIELDGDYQKKIDEMQGEGAME